MTVTQRCLILQKFLVSYLQNNFRNNFINGLLNLFRLYPQYVMRPRLQSTCHYIVNHYLKIWYVRLGDANNMLPLSGVAQTEKIRIISRFIDHRGKRDLEDIENY